MADNETDTDAEPAVRMIGTLPPNRGVPGYCETLYHGIDEKLDAFTFAGWRELYPASLYPGESGTTCEPPTEGEHIERSLAWYDPVSWLRAGLNPDTDLLHAQWWSYPLAIPYVVMFVASKLRGTTVLLTVHNVEPHEKTPLTRFLNNLVYLFADEYVVHSEQNKAQFCRKRAVDPDDVHVISHPTIGPEERGISKAAARRELGIDTDGGVVLFFGNVREYKGLDSLIRMVDDIGDERALELIIAGECWEDWDEYAALIESRGLTDRVHRFPGYIPEADLEFHFTAADVVALPYDYFDAQSGVAELADNFGTVSVGYDVGGLAEQVDVVAEDRAAFESALLAAVDGEVTKESVDDESVANHVRLYRALDAPRRSTPPNQ
ncbi:glycosyltransferase family 4 protein [Haloarcula sp. S1CR25-12]|uniref:Glycosyltransferase family 4 protein n=1 Tax=Haloarcula saliterrae TaxID=2950534 RepID=A0ABU2FGH9_9EURY|nr:glycosyltransferase family 4 protein [Haloarcula sp. S1CR25-12]MDS0261356.1 glycosyltransferase family 4 protein [Haloarcula sp. S1CR25-12]